MAKRDTRIELSIVRGVHAGASSVVDKKGQNSYKTKERELVAEINGEPSADPEAALASVASRLRKAGVTQRYGQRS